MNTREKGDALENRLYEYLIEQKETGQLVFGTYTPYLCKIHKKKSYYCPARKAPTEFDVVIELSREGAPEPHSKIIFECKNYTNKRIPESDISIFSDKLSRIGKHNTIGILVTNTKLQSGAKSLIKSYHIGIAKFNANGLEIVAERRVQQLYQDIQLDNQIFENHQYSKSLKFSACYNGKYHGSVQSLINWTIKQENSDKTDDVKLYNNNDIPFISHEEIEQKASKLLKDIDHQGGAVNLEVICSHLSINLEWDNQHFFGENGSVVLGKADFYNRKITVYSHGRLTRERFTISHEIGHFHLNHDNFLHSESIIKKDLFINDKDTNKFEINKLEYQANFFASCLLLPKESFLRKTDEIRKVFDIRNKGHGDIYVDNQPCNIADFYRLLDALSGFFLVSTQAIEIRLKVLKKLVDKRDS